MNRNIENKLTTNDISTLYHYINDETRTYTYNDIEKTFSQIYSKVTIKFHDEDEFDVFFSNELIDAEEYLVVYDIPEKLVLIIYTLNKNSINNIEKYMIDLHYDIDEYIYCVDDLKKLYHQYLIEYIDVCKKSTSDVCKKNLINCSKALKKYKLERIQEQLI